MKDYVLIVQTQWPFHCEDKRMQYLSFSVLKVKVIHDKITINYIILQSFTAKLKVIMFCEV
jgi:hypothetical protein